jgi:ubiquinone/menaquinone biosynthesis C-methylase UbiE
MRADPTRIIDMASAYYDSCILFAASDLGIFGKLAELGEASSARVAEDLGLDARGTRLLLDACVALGLLGKEGQSYRNSEAAGVFLVPGCPGDLSGAIRYNRDVLPAWAKLERMVRTGGPVERQDVHLGEDPERTRIFVLAMHARAKWIGPALIPFMDLSRKKRLLDIGGGSGTFSVLLAKAYPALTCTVFDLPEVVRIAQSLIESQGMKDRVKVLPANYHADDFPAGNDVVTILGVLHQESPESIQGILKRAYCALDPGGIIYVLDVMTEATHTAPKFSALFAVNMALTASAGWVFSDAELREWMAGAGFSEIEIRPLPAPMPHWLARARRA